MAKLFDSADRIVPTWLQAVSHLSSLRGEPGRNLVLEIHKPMELTPEDHVVIEKVDAALREHTELSVKTVAGTIFPQGFYRRYGRPEMYQRYITAMKRAKKSGTWGTYALRMMSRRGAAKDEIINPLETIVEKLVRATGEGHPYQSAYELGVQDPTGESGAEFDGGCELPIYDPARDRGKATNMPCLSHLSFKLGKDKAVELTAIYRSHYYCQRALGNLIGLGQLLNFVATEAKLGVGTLTCVSTHAVLDLENWGPAASHRAVLTSLNT